MPKRPGMARVDALVVLFILASAAALILAGVVRIREGATAIQCENNLRQLALGFQNYLDMHSGRLPSLVDQGKGVPIGLGLPSVFATLWPFMEGSNLYFRAGMPMDRYNGHSSVVFKYDHKGEPCTQSGGLANQIIKVYLNPADNTSSQLQDVPMVLPDGSTGYYATGSYVANGLLPWSPGIAAKALPGGFTNTVLFAERPQVCRTADGDEVYNLWGLGVYSPHVPAFAVLTPTDPPGLWDTGQVAPVLPLPDESRLESGALIRVRIGREDAEPTTPNFNPLIQYVRKGQPCDPRLPATPHRKGMQAAMGDGSVRVFERNTDPWVVWSACVSAEPQD
jgi:hypothetical protein